MTQHQDQQSLEDAQVKDHSNAQEAEIVNDKPAEESTNGITPDDEKAKAAEAAAADKQPEAPKSVLTDDDKRAMTLAARNTETSVLSPVMYNQSKLVAKDFYDSGALPKHIQNETQAFVTIITGAEMGMKPMQAIQSLYIINGIITLWGKAVPRQIKAHGYRFQFFDESQESCSVRVWKVDMYGNKVEGEEYEETFTYQDAVQSKYTVDSYGKTKVGWLPGQNRKLKMRYNVLSALIKTYIPEVLGEAADIAEVANDYIEGETVNDSKTADPKAAIREAQERRKAQGSTTSTKSAPKPVEQEQGENEAV